MNDDLDRQIVNFWGSMLVPIPQKVLSAFNLSLETDLFLKNIGLPLQNYIELYKYLQGKLGPLQFYSYGAIGDESYVTSYIPHFVLVGDFYKDPELIRKISVGGNILMTLSDLDQYSHGMRLAINTNTNEVVYIVREELRYINSNIKIALLFASIYIANYSFSPAKESAEGALQLVSEIKKQFSELDPKAVESDDTFWSDVLDASL